MVSWRLSQLFLTCTFLDVCLGGDTRTPEGTLEAILIADEETSGVTMAAMNYYVLDGCDGRFNMKEQADFFIQLLGDLNNILEDIFVELDVNRQLIEAGCGLEFGTLDPRQRSLRNLIGTFQDFTEIVKSTSAAMRCERINSLFINIFHGLLCTDVPYSFSWMFSTMVPLYLIGMFMILCRGALLPPQLVDDYDDESPRDMNDSELSHRYDTDQAINGEDESFIRRSDTKNDTNDTSDTNFSTDELKPLKCSKCNAAISKRDLRSN